MLTQRMERGYNQFNMGHVSIICKKDFIMSDETLVVISKVKNYIRTQAQMNTASNVGDKLSDILRALCDSAIESARKNGRKTVMDKDFE
jgi:hypothetical protein